MASDRRMGLLVLGLGAATALAVQLAAPTRRPLYDGVVVTEPYAWLDPPAFNLGGATGVSATITVKGSESPVVALATDEQPPQAQILATPGALRLHAGTTSIAISIDPVPPPAAPPTGFIDGNVYDFRLVDDAGRPLTAPAEAEVTVVLRSADPLRTEATIVWFDGSRWVPLPTTPSGDGEFFATVTEFGAFAVLAQGDNPYATLAPSGLPVQVTATPVLPGSAPPTASMGITPAASAPSGTPAPTSSGVPIVVWIVGLALLVIGGGLGALVWLQRREDRRRGW
ncbi:MAG TPA: hypothetical protein VFI34_01555 [Candidatus Limnocylindrales bacterium]|nr:hypothetical protein [Candidatus Limnocylindrales bacterium]